MSREVADAFAALLDVPAELARLREEVVGLRTKLDEVQRALPPLLVSRKQAAEHLRVSESTIKRRIADGSIIETRKAGRPLIDLTQLRPLSNDEVVELAHGKAESPRLAALRRVTERPRERAPLKAHERQSPGLDTYTTKDAAAR